jgi:hypothetical protein
LVLQPVSRQLSGVLAGLTVLALVGCSGPTPSAQPAGRSAAPASSLVVTSGSQPASASLAPTATTSTTTSLATATPTSSPTCAPERPMGTPAPGIASFRPTGSLITGRAVASATLLRDGRVLVSGGRAIVSPGGGLAKRPGPASSAELYDPATGTFSVTGSMSHARFNHTATLLPNGKVLIAGGEQGYTDEQPLSSAELYNPATGRFSPTGSMSHVRTMQTATLLRNGKVLIAGGDDATGPLSSTELYDPATGRFSPTGAMSIGREEQTATLLANGKVLIAGGFYYAGPLAEPTVDEMLSSAELYDPATGEFTATRSMHVARFDAVAIELLDGRVLIASGGDISSCSIGSAEIYDPATGTFSLVGSLANGRMGLQAALLRDGRVLIVGGWNMDGLGLASAEVFDPTTSTFSPTGSMSIAQASCTAASLADGRVLVLGGSGGTSPFLASAEVYTP